MWSTLEALRRIERGLETMLGASDQQHSKQSQPKQSAESHGAVTDFQISTFNHIHSILERIRSKNGGKFTQEDSEKAEIHFTHNEKMTTLSIDNQLKYSIPGSTGQMLTPNDIKHLEARLNGYLK